MFWRQNVNWIAKMNFWETIFEIWEHQCLFFSCFHYWDLMTNNWRFINCHRNRTLIFEILLKPLIQVNLKKKYTFTRIEENISWKRWSKNKKAASKNISFNCASWTPKWSPLLYRPNWDSYYRRFICMDWTLKSLLKATLLSGLLYARADSLFTVAIFLTVFRFELLKFSFSKNATKICAILRTVLMFAKLMSKP